jgi:cyclic pyranopterin monophosphate synthase
MWDVSGKSNTARTATAQAVLRMDTRTMEAIKEGKVPKGDPLPVAKVAAVQAAKNTPAIIPYCHPLPLTHVGVSFDLGVDMIQITVETKTDYKTGVEMEALTAAAAAALTLYDMLKQIDMGMTIESVMLLKKTGGKSDFHAQGGPNL